MVRNMRINRLYRVWNENLSKKRNNVLVTAFGETKTITQWTRDPRCVVDSKTIKRRMGIGISPESALVHEAYA